VTEEAPGRAAVALLVLLSTVSKAVAQTESIGRVPESAVAVTDRRLNLSSRPGPWVKALYGINIIGRALDAHSTRQAMNAGFTERNPLLRPLAHHPAIFTTAEIGAGVGTVLLVERLRKRHRKVAIVLLTAITGLQGWAVAHNYHLALSHPAPNTTGVRDE
jgi:hypothetical protein